MRPLSKFWRRKYSVPPVTAVDFAAAASKETRPWILFRPDRKKAAYVRAGVLGSGAKMAQALVRRLAAEGM